MREADDEDPDGGEQRVAAEVDLAFSRVSRLNAARPPVYASAARRATSGRTRVSSGRLGSASRTSTAST